MDVDVEIRLLAHATEDEKMLKEKAKEAFGKEFEMKKLFGYWGNPIYYISSILKGKEAKEFLKKLLRIFSKEEILSRYDDEEKSSFVRLSKEAIVDGKLEKGNDLQIKIHFKSHTKIDKEKVKRWLDEVEG